MILFFEGMDAMYRYFWKGMDAYDTPCIFGKGLICDTPVFFGMDI